MYKMDYITIHYKCPCGFAFNQKDGDGRKFDMIQRMHKKKCDKYVDEVDDPVTTYKFKTKMSKKNKEVGKFCNIDTI